MNRTPEKLSLEELQQRLIPGGYSDKGFLGANEQLAEILQEDDHILAEAGLLHAELAAAIESILGEALSQKENLLRSSRPEQAIARATDYPNLYRPETLPLFSSQNMPPADKGWMVGKYQVFIMQYRGIQECPWDCAGTFGSYDFLILNRQTGDFFTGPALAVHLIREHHFFEGKGTPFRCDPEKVIRVLELVSKV